MPGILAVGTFALGAAGLANKIYQETQTPGAGGAGGGQPQFKETPQERAFYETQTLNAEKIANAEADAAQTAANSTFEITSFFKWVLLALLMYAAWKKLGLGSLKKLL